MMHTTGRIPSLHALQKLRATVVIFAVPANNCQHLHCISQHSDVCTCLVKWSLQQVESAVIWSGSRSIVRYRSCVLQETARPARTHACITPERQPDYVCFLPFPHPNKRQRLAEAIEGIHHQLFFVVVQLVNAYKFLQSRFCGVASCGEVREPTPLLRNADAAPSGD